MACVGKCLFYAVVFVFIVFQGLVDKRSMTQILVKNGLPTGLLPATVKSYSLATNGTFQVNLWSACTTKIGAEELYYKNKITGELSYQQIKNVAGIQIHQWLWVSVTDIKVDKIIPKTIWFKIGYLSKALSTDLFQIAPTCTFIAEEEAEEARHAMTFSEWLSKALDGNLEVNALDCTLEVNVPNSLNTGTARKMLQ